MPRSSVKVRVLGNALKYLYLTRIVISARGLSGLHRYAKSFGVRNDSHSRCDPDLCISHFQLARHLYPNPNATCLHLACACALLMRRYGLPAEIVIGVTSRPFFAHAWVDLCGVSVFGTVDASRYTVMERM